MIEIKHKIRRKEKVMKNLATATALAFMATCHPVMAGQYCVPYETALDYQVLNGWWMIDQFQKINETVQVWIDTDGNHMLTIYVPDMYDLETGRHSDMMCQRRNK